MEETERIMQIPESELNPPTEPLESKESSEEEDPLSVSEDENVESEAISDPSAIIFALVICFNA